MSFYHWPTVTHHHHVCLVCVLQCKFVIAFQYFMLMVFMNSMLCKLMFAFKALLLRTTIRCVYCKDVIFIHLIRYTVNAQCENNHIRICISYTDCEFNHRLSVYDLTENGWKCRFRVVGLVGHAEHMVRTCVVSSEFFMKKKNSVIYYTM